VIGSLGESLIDFTPLGDDGFELHPGGSPFNVATAVGTLGHPAAFVGRISTDLFGVRLVEALQVSGVDTRFVVRSAEPTTLAFVAFHGDEAVYSFRGEGAADVLLSASDVDVEELAALEALHLGSISLLREPVGTTATGVARALHGKVVLSLDPNVRGGLVGDWGPYRRRLAELAGFADIVKASEADLELWGVGPAALEGPAAVVVTRGAGGSTVHAAGEVFDVPAHPCEVVDTIGAGDAFTAGLLVALARRGALTCRGLRELDSASWEEAVRRAAEVSAMACARRGALSASPS
jgi:fructokinase